MEKKTTEEEIAELKMDIEAMKNIPLLEESYLQKVERLMKLRRSQTRKGRKK